MTEQHNQTQSPNKDTVHSPHEAGTVEKVNPQTGNTTTESVKPKN